MKSKSHFQTYLPSLPANPRAASSHAPRRKQFSNSVSSVIIKISICLFGGFLLTGCGGIDMSTPEETRLTGNYHYKWHYDYEPSKLVICRRISDSGYTTLIRDVVAYGWTKHFIIAKCRVSGDTNATSYSIIRINESASTEMIAQGLSAQEFRIKRTEWAVPPELKFTRDYQ